MEEVVAWARFWASASWPMTEDVAIDRGVAHLGWSLDEQGEAVGPWPLNVRDVSLSRVFGAKDCHSFSFKVTDVIGLPREQLDAEGQRVWEAFLRDRFTLLVRGLTVELGKPETTRERIDGELEVVARWDLSEGGIRWDLVHSPRSVDVYVESPATAARERRLGN